MGIEIEQDIAAGHEMSELDIRTIKIALNKLSFYTPDFDKGINGDADQYFFEAVKNFQISKMMQATGKIFADGLTMEMLNRELENPNNFMIFKRHYIWRSVGDQNVRGSHAAREGQQFSWDMPPDGGNPGEDFGCRCWAEPVMLMTPKGLKVGQQNLLNAPELDAIHSTISPLDFLGGSVAIFQGGRVLLGSFVASKSGKLVFQTTRQIVGSSARILTSRFRKTDWIDKTPRSQIQHGFRHAKNFGIKGNQNNKNLKLFRDALKMHIKSKDTIVIKGTYHKKPMTHYYNPKTRLNIMRDPNNQLRSTWELRDMQHFHMLKDGKLGGSKK